MAEDKPKLLIVEDDPGLQKQLKWCFDGYEVIAATDRPSAMAALRRHEPAVVLQDLGLPPDAEGVSEGFACLLETLRIAPRTKVIVVTGQLDKQNAVRAVGMGAYDFYQKPVDTDVLRLLVQRAFHIHGLEEQNRALIQRQGSMPLAGVIAISESMMKACRTIEKVAPTNASVLLLGDSGTGKELLARAVHTLSPRAERPFVAINCAAIPDTLLESELFGYEKGAFTGAVKQTQGKFEHANGGTLFLDEIGDMPLSLQAKLLRFLQDRVVERIGGRDRIAVDVRIVCATNKDLPAIITSGEFREDLYYRISEVTVRIPPLRDRAGDAVVIAQAILDRRAREHGRAIKGFTPEALKAIITSGEFREDLYYRISEVTVRIPPLRDRAGDAVVIAQAILDRRAREHGRAIKGFTPEALKAIEAYPWPGNIRELENRVNGAVIMTEGKYVSVEDLGLPSGGGADLSWLNLRVARQRAECEAIRQALAVAGWNLSRTAELLGITRPTLYDLLDKNDIAVPEKAAEG